MLRRPANLFLVLALCVLGGACSRAYVRSVASLDGPPKRSVDVANIPDAVPRYETVKKAGNRSPYQVLGKTYFINFEPPDNYSEQGYASWYGTKFHGNKTANGEVYDMYAMTAAHKTLPIPSYVKVTNIKNNKSVVVRVNDRGPFHEGRIVDLSYVAAKKLDMLDAGTAPVKLERLSVKPPLAQPEGVRGIYLQVGAFKQAAYAYRLEKQVAQVTRYRTQVLRYDNSELYKVLVGPLASETALPRLRRDLASVNITNTYVLHKR